MPREYYTVAPPRDASHAALIGLVADLNRVLIEISQEIGRIQGRDGNTPTFMRPILVQVPTTAASATSAIDADTVDGLHASDFTTAAGLATHIAAPDPHPVYVTQAEGDGRYVRLPILPEDYTVSNLTTDRIYDANATTIAELADVLGTLIADLTAIGLLQ